MMENKVLDLLEDIERFIELLSRFTGKVRQNLAPIVGTILRQSMATHTRRIVSDPSHNLDSHT